MSAGSSGVVATDDQLRSLLDQSITRDFNTLDQGGMIIAEYVWIGGTGQDVRSKARCVSPNRRCPSRFAHAQAPR